MRVLILLLVMASALNSQLSDTILSTLHIVLCNPHTHPLSGCCLIIHNMGNWDFWGVCAQSCLTLCDHMDYSLPASSIRGVFQARILEWVSISYSWWAGFKLRRSGMLKTWAAPPRAWVGGKGMHHALSLDSEQHHCEDIGVMQTGVMTKSGWSY